MTCHASFHVRYQGTKSDSKTEACVKYMSDNNMVITYKGHGFGVVVHYPHKIDRLGITMKLPIDS